jgi:hypothetical protein
MSAEVTFGLHDASSGQHGDGLGVVDGILARRTSLDGRTDQADHRHGEQAGQRAPHERERHVGAASSCVACHR